jgi:hypothetical protein
MMSLSLRLSFALVGALIAATWAIVPRGVDAGHWLAAQDDPVELAELALDRNLDARVIQHEIEAALDAGDVELAESFIALAHERVIAVDPALAARVNSATSGSARAAHGAGQFVRGLVIGEPEDLASLAGTATGDLFVFGDARDAVREGVRLARGEEADEMILGLACVGLAITAGTYASLGMATPARLGLSVIKAARKTGRIGAHLSGAVVRAVRESVDATAVKQAFTRAALVRPLVAVRAIREAVKVEKAGGLLDLVRDVSRVQSSAGTQAALDGLKLADEPKDVARLARLSEAKGLSTRAVIKLFGRGAIMLTTGVFTLAMWVFWAIVDVVLLCAAIKRAAERVTLRIIERGKARRAPVRALPFAPPARAV